jgi:hypothetical protein
MQSARVATVRSVRGRKFISRSEFMTRIRQAGLVTIAPVEEIVAPAPDHPQ